VPTDTLKNTIYALAKQHAVTSIESFGQTLAQHFIAEFDHVSRVTVRLSEQPWQRILVDGSEHDHAFSAAGSERYTAVVSSDRQSMKTTSGLNGLVVLKTTGSGFGGFLQDRFTTLRESDDRIFATTITAEWDACNPDIDWASCRHNVRQKLLEVFATHDSASVQHTLYAMAIAVLDTSEAIQSITLKMPNQHRLLVDLEAFGLANPNEIFVPTREPYGMICATVKRDSET